VIAAEAGIDAVDLLKGIDYPRLRQAVWRQPAGDIGKASRDGGNGAAPIMASLTRAPLSVSDGNRYCVGNRLLLGAACRVNATKRSGTLRGSRGENCIQNFGRRIVFDAKLSEFEPTSTGCRPF
jgi:hypothetical protein